MNASNQNRQNTILAWIILTGLALVWGSSYILIKRGLESFSSDEVGALRISITFLFLVPFAIHKVRKLLWREWKYLAIVGLIGSLLPAFLFAKAQTGIDSSLAGILNSLTPLFTLIIGISFFSAKTKWFNITGILIALLGTIGLISISGGKSFELNIHYAIYVIIATLCYAINVNIVKYKLPGTDATTITAISFFIIGLPVVLYLLIFTGFIEQVKTDPLAWQGIGYIGLLSVVGTALAMMAFNKLIKIASPVFASSVTYLSPIVAVSWGAMDRENMPLQSYLWMALILFGVFLVNKKKLSFV